MPTPTVRTLLAATAVLTACNYLSMPSEQQSADVAAKTTAVAPDAAPPPATQPPSDPAWVDAGGGMSVRLDLPPGPYKLGDTLTIGLEFRNDVDDERRIYLVDPPDFRAQQSDMQLLGQGGKVLDSQPEPHPHGYVVSERDFPALPPDAVQKFSQPLRLDREALGSNLDAVQLRWTYRNNIESWAGGVQTLDGPTRPLFGGGPIPGIWLGEVSVTVPLELAR